MPVDRATKVYVTRRIGIAAAAIKIEQLKVLLDHLPRHDEFALTDIAVGTVEQAVSWLVPITGDYAILVAPTTAAGFVGMVTATVKAGTKTPTGCTLIVANRAVVSIGAATFDVLAFPIGGS